jgi:transketolase
MKQEKNRRSKGKNMNTELVKDLEQEAKELRKLTIEMIGKLGVGHIGGCLSIMDVLSVLFFHEMNIDPKDPKMADRDRFILSKGHGGPAVYSALALKGYFDISELDTLNRSNTKLPSHCDMNLTRGIDMTAGSLGQGFSAAMGFAIAGKIDKKDYTVYTIIGDGESQEGQIWEAAMLAGSRKLDNVIAFTDFNNAQIDGTSDEINSIRPLDAKWEAFNWHVQVIDGHDIGAILEAIKNAKEAKGKPSMIIMNTIKGKGAYFAEGLVTSHNMPVTDEMWKTACAQLDESEVQ